MSTCISQHGEFSSHETGDDFTCRLCFAFDEAGALAEIERLRQWKKEALPVLDGLQELGRALGLPLGERITGPSAVEAANGLRVMLDDERAAKKVAADAADRFRDVLSECLGHEDENPGDDVLVAELRKHFGRTGPEPTRWREFISGALAQVDQINAERRVIPPGMSAEASGQEGECK